jgi:ribosome maturation factor RimP
VWRSDRGERLLEVTVERPGTTEPGAGVTLDLCTEISRDLSAALDVADCVPGRYRLEVGSPGLERALYGVEDFRRFAGRSARVKVRAPVKGQHVLVGTILTLESAELVGLDVRGERVEIAIADVENARLVFEWRRGEPPGRPRPGQGRKARDVRPRARNGASE